MVELIGRVVVVLSEVVEFFERLKKSKNPASPTDMNNNTHNMSFQKCILVY